MFYIVYGFRGPSRELKRMCTGMTQTEALRRAAELNRVPGGARYDSPFIVSRSGSVFSIAAVTFNPPPTPPPPPATIGPWV